MNSSEDLKDLVLGWAKGNQEDCKDWLGELNAQNIRDLEDLLAAASGSVWNDFTFSPMLKTRISNWRKADSRLNATDKRETALKRKNSEY
jgi:hypothetical protein